MRTDQRNRDRPDERQDGLCLVLRLAVSAVGASAALVFSVEGQALTVLAQHGLRGDPKQISDELIAALNQEVGGPLWSGVRPVVCLAGPQSFGLVVRIEGNGPAGLLVVLSETPINIDRSKAEHALRDIADLVALHLPACRAIPSRSRSSEHRRALAEALETLPEAIAIFDRQDRFLFWNQQFERIYAPPGVVIRAGLRFEDHLRACLDVGHVIAARGREEEWLAERLARFNACDGAHEHQLSDGRWVRVQERTLPGGGKVGIRADITGLVNREQSIRLLFDGNPVPMLVIEKETLRILSVNAAAIAFYGYSEPEFLELSLPRIRAEATAGEIRLEQLSDPSFASAPRVHVTATGDKRIVNVRACDLDYAGRAAVLVAVFDMTDRHRMETEVRQARAFLNNVVDNIPASVFVKDMWDGGRYVLYNRAGKALLGRRSAEIIGHTAVELLGAENAARLVEQDEVAFQLGDAGVVEEQVIRDATGRERWLRTRKVALADEGGDRRYVLGVSEDVTEQRASEARIAHMAHHDALTGLPNRFLLHDRLEAALARMTGRGDMLAVLCIDLDGFKPVNDAWGHAAGDDLLRCAANRMRELAKPADTVSRTGGDEFVVLQTPIVQAGEAAWLAGRLMASLSKPYTFDGSEIRVGVSIGIALAPMDGKGGDILLKRADDALYEAKRNGRHQFLFADPKLRGLSEPTRNTSPDSWPINAI